MCAEVLWLAQVLFVLGAILLFWFGCAMAAFKEEAVTVQYLRLTTLELRGADIASAPGVHVASFGALRHSCKVCPSSHPSSSFPLQPAP